MRLVRTKSDKVVLGVCGGVAKYFGWDAAIVRVIFAVCTIAGIGSPILIYLLMGIIMPSEY